MKYKMLVEFVKKEETENGAIGLTESGKIMQDISRVAKKNKLDCYVKGYPKEKLNYKHTNKTIEINTVEDIAKLSEQQFEFFIDDLRQWCEITRGVSSFKELLGDMISQPKGMTWLDTGLNEGTINIKTTNKI